MKNTPFEFNGRTYALSFTAEALFTTYDKFGVCDDIIAATHCLEPTAEGWRNCCWLAALMASQGELQRRSLGYDKQPMLTAEELRVGVMAVDNARLRMAVRHALEQAFHRDIPDPAPEQEVNLVLREREEAQKKNGGRDLRPRFLAACARILALRPADALLLCPGTAFDMIRAALPREDPEDTPGPVPEPDLSEEVAD